MWTTTSLVQCPLSANYWILTGVPANLHLPRRQPLNRRYCANLSPGRNWLGRRYSCCSIHVNVTIVIAVMFSLSAGTRTRSTRRYRSRTPSPSLSHSLQLLLDVIERERAVGLFDCDQSQKLEQKEDDIEEVEASFVSTKHLIKLHVLGHHHLPWHDTRWMMVTSPPSLLHRIHYRPISICHKRDRQTPHTKSTNNVWDASELHAIGNIITAVKARWGWWCCVLSSPSQSVSQSGNFHLASVSKHSSNTALMSISLPRRTSARLQCIETHTRSEVLIKWRVLFTY